MSEEKHEAEEVCSLCQYHRTAGIHVLLRLPGSHRFRTEAAHSPVLDAADRIQAERDAFLVTIEQQREQIEALEKERDGLKADRDRLDWLEANWLQKVKWITPLESMDGNPLWSTESVPSIGGFQEEITDSLRRSVDLHRECHLLKKERDSLRVELERQWASDHGEYCQSDYPHDGICHVPKPKYLEASCPR